MTRSNPRSPWRLLLALLTVSSLVVAACGGDDDDVDGGATPTTEQPSDGSDGTDGTESGGDADPEGVVRVGYDLVAATRGGLTWDPTEVTTQLTDTGLFYLVYGSLLRPTAEGDLEPDLAESTEIVDPNTIEVALRDGLTFSDGTPFDADAVKAGLERSLAATGSAGFGSAFFDLETVEVVDPTTVRLLIPNGTAASWHDTFLGSWETTIVKPDLDPSQPIGAGPMVVGEFAPEQRIVLERSDTYWEADAVRLGGIELIHAPDGTSGASALQAGQIDVARIDTVQIPTVEGDAEVLLKTDPNALMHGMICKRDEPLSDPLVRKALNKAVDRELLSEAVFDGAFEPAHGLWPEGHRFHSPDVTDEVSFDPEGAVSLLEEAGHGDGLEIDVYVIQSGGMPDVAAVLQQQFADVGVTANLIPAPNYVADFLQPQPPGMGLVPTISPNRLKLLQWSGESIGNTCGFSDPELEALAAELAAVSDASDEAEELWHQIEEKVVAEDALSLFLLFNSTVVAYDDDALGDVQMMPFTIPVPDVRSTYVKA